MWALLGFQPVCPALPCPALPCPALLRFAALRCLLCFARFALLCPALPCVALLCSALRCSDCCCRSISHWVALSPGILLGIDSVTRRRRSSSKTLLLASRRRRESRARLPPKSARAKGGLLYPLSARAAAERELGPASLPSLPPSHFSCFFSLVLVPHVKSGRARPAALRRGWLGCGYAASSSRRLLVAAAVLPPQRLLPAIPPTAQPPAP